MTRTRNTYWNFLWRGLNVEVNLKYRLESKHCFSDERWRAIICSIFFQRCAQYIFLFCLKVRCWDPEVSSWTSEGIEEAEWQPGKRVVRLHTTRSGPTADQTENIRAIITCFAATAVTPNFQLASGFPDQQYLVSTGSNGYMRRERLLNAPRTSPLPPPSLVPLRKFRPLSVHRVGVGKTLSSTQVC